MSTEPSIADPQMRRMAEAVQSRVQEALAHLLGESSLEEFGNAMKAATVRAMGMEHAVDANKAGLGFRAEEGATTVAITIEPDWQSFWTDRMRENYARQYKVDPSAVTIEFDEHHVVGVKVVGKFNTLIVDLTIEVA